MSSSPSDGERPFAGTQSTQAQAPAIEQRSAVTPATVTSRAPVAAPTPQTHTGVELKIAGLDPPRAHDGAGFSERGRIRRRLRFLDKARELAYRDLGGLVFDLHRFGQRHDELVAAKLGALERIDAELRALRAALSQRNGIAVLREAGIAACPRCAAIHGSEDRFCPACGMPTDHRAEHPIAVPPQQPGPGAQGQPAQAPPPGQTSLPLPGSAPIPVPVARSVGSWAGEGAPAQTGLLRAPTPAQSAPAEDQPTEIIPPRERPEGHERPSPQGQPGGDLGAR